MDCNSSYITPMVMGMVALDSSHIRVSDVTVADRIVVCDVEILVFRVGGYSGSMLEDKEKVQKRQDAENSKAVEVFSFINVTVFV